MNFTVRTCELNDTDAICKLNADEMGYQYSPDETAQKIKLVLVDEKQHIFVAANNDEVLGYIHAAEYELLYAPKMVNILGIAVLKKYQKNGVGRALLSEIENWAKNVGAAYVRLSSGEERTDAHSFYIKNGYELSKKQLNFKKRI